MLNKFYLLLEKAVSVKFTKIIGVNYNPLPSENNFVNYSSLYITRPYC